MVSTRNEANCLLACPPRTLASLPPPCPRPEALSKGAPYPAHIPDSTLGHHICAIPHQAQMPAFPWLLFKKERKEKEVEERPRLFKAKFHFSIFIIATKRKYTAN